MPKKSREFSKLHSRSLFGSAPKLKINKDKFEKNSEYAHLIGRAFACELIINKHKVDPYLDVDEVLGDLHIQLVDCMNQFRENALYHKSDKFKVESLI